MDRFIARIYTPGKIGPDQHLRIMAVPSMNQAKQLGKRIAEEMGGRLVNVFKVKECKAMFREEVKNQEEGA